MVNISLDTLPIRAVLEVPEQARDTRLLDRSRQVITTCGPGNLAAMGTRLLKEMGFTNVTYMGGCRRGRTLACPRTRSTGVRTRSACWAYPE